MTEADRIALRARLVARLPTTWRTRFAPAPTGPLHLGHAVNAVFVWSIARAFGGSVLLRIEDHDGQRSRTEHDAGIIEDLAWLGLHADNCVSGWPFPVRQRDNQLAYTEALRVLADRGVAYACRCSRRDIAAFGATNAERELRYAGTCRRSEVPATETPARRIQLDDTMVEFDDLRHGIQQQTPSHQCGDLLARDRRADWTYHFAVVVDDLRQGVDVVIRGDDLLNSTGRQLMLATLLGRPCAPLFVHHPLVSHPNGTKLSKSHGDTGLSDLRRDGWSPAQVLGHAAWLGGLQTDRAPVAAADLHQLWGSAP